MLMRRLVVFQPYVMIHTAYRSFSPSYNNNNIIDHSVNSILYQRGLYPQEDFEPVKRNGLSLWTTTDPALKTYLKTLLVQLESMYHYEHEEKTIFIKSLIYS
jgi:hypothetical protein